MNLSYWEYKTWLSRIDFTIVGSGIVGLTTALHLKKRFPKAKILILEKGILPQGASTKNAGFACFGSISELLGDLKTHSEDALFQLVQKRWNGIQTLRQLLGDDHLGFKKQGGHELFLEDQDGFYETCLESLPKINKLLHPIFKTDAFSTHANSFHFRKIKEHYISNMQEAQIDTGTMMARLLYLAQRNGIRILNSVTVETFAENQDHVMVNTDQFEVKTRQLLVATNGFATELLNEDCVPARAQVLLTEPIKNLHIKGTFHLDQGYYYFRNIDDRILLGGGRNLDKKGEETAIFGKTDLIQNQLEKMLRAIIVPKNPVGISMRWSGIMGVGTQKKPIVKRISPHVICGVRMGGMGIAIGSMVGKELAQIAWKDN